MVPETAPVVGVSIVYEVPLMLNIFVPAVKPVPAVIIDPT
jgi:hypothetical protein